MITSKLKEKLKKYIKRPIDISELEAIAIEKGKTKLKQYRHSGGTSYEWDESEIPDVINKLNAN